MAAPVVGAVALRYAAVRIGAFLGRKALTTYGKKTAAKRMTSEAAKRGGHAMAPAPQGPLGTLGLIQLSTGGEHASRSGTPYAGTSTPGPSAQNQPGTSRKKPGRRVPLADRRGPATSRERRPRTVRYRKGGCPPGYRYDRRRRMCVLI
jgi:hypothetical protein